MEDSGQELVNGDTLQARCAELALSFLAQRDWRLVEEPQSFLAAVVQEARHRLARGTPRTLDDLIREAFTNRYCHLWYDACRAVATPRQQRAFHELHCELGKVAQNICADPFLAAESAQSALERVWPALEQVKDPGAFLHWARMIAIRETRARMKREGRRNVVEVDEDAAEAVLWEEGRAFVPLQPALRARVEAALRECLPNVLHQALIIGAFLDQKTLGKLADELGRTVKSLSEAKSKALRRLRGCERLRILFEEL